MPTQPGKHRTYCKTCQEFTIHSSNIICQNCDTKFTPYTINNVDKDKIKHQRERYNKQNQKEMLGIYGAFIQGNGLKELMNFDEKIIECDAGQKEINKNKQLVREKVRQKAEELRQEYIVYKHLNRNDKCLCESGKKYKQCHLIYFKEAGVKF